jgi:hypothetical protein
VLLSPDGQQKKAFRYGKYFLSVSASSERELPAFAQGYGGQAGLISVGSSERNSG